MQSALDPAAGSSGAQAYPHLFSPGRAGPVTLPNRIVMAPMDDNMADRHGRVTEHKIAWYERRARGGAGWVTVGCTFVTAAGRAASHFQLGIEADDAVAGLSELTARVRRHGARVGIQLCHAGRQATTVHLPDGLRPEAPSALTEPLLGHVPTVLERGRIAEIVEEFGDAARRARQAGFDLVEIHGAHGFLQHQFLSPLANDRDDEYGGSLENRARFAVECVRAIRAAAGADLAVGFRLPCDDATEGGLVPDDALQVLRWLEAAGVDYVSVTAGRGGSYASARMILGPPGIGPGHLERYARMVKATAGVPVLSAGRYDTPELAEQVLAAGSADHVIMGRALIADPDMPRKAREGRRRSVRQCVACEQGCIDRWLASLDATCTINPEAGRESDPAWATLETREPATGRRVLVVGAGPAGLEAARTAALRGHDVTLWEARAEVGGQVRLAARAPVQQEWGRWITWLATQVHEAGVAVERGRHATPDDVLAFGADTVVVATGARPAPPRDVPGWDAPHVTDPFAVLGGAALPGPRVVVVGGETIGARTALFLADAGHEVTLVAGATADMFDDGSADLARDMLGPVIRPMVLEWLHEQVDVRTKRIVKRIVREGVIVDAAGAFAPHTASTRITDADAELLAADTVVLGVGRAPESSLYDALAGRLPDGALLLAGDALAPRTVTEAMLTGARCGRAATVPASLTAA